MTHLVEAKYRRHGQSDAVALMRRGMGLKAPFHLVIRVIRVIEERDIKRRPSQPG